MCGTLCAPISFLIFFRLDKGEAQKYMRRFVFHRKLPSIEHAVDNYAEKNIAKFVRKISILIRRKRFCSPKKFQIYFSTSNVK